MAVLISLRKIQSEFSTTKYLATHEKMLFLCYENIVPIALKISIKLFNVLLDPDVALIA